MTCAAREVTISLVNDNGHRAGRPGRRPARQGDRPVSLETLLPLLVPILVIQLGLLIWALYDLTRPGRRVKGDSKVVWALIIIFVNLIGPILYFVVGREET
jgi:hypothetical protein